MSATIQAPDPLAVSDPVTLGTGTAVAGKVVSRDKGDVTVNEVSLPGSSTNSRLSIATANGPVPTQMPTRDSPSIPNGKPTSPHVERSNIMPNGGSTAPQTVSSKDPKAAAQAASDMRNIVRRKLTGYVGFANLPNQWHRKSVRKGFNFNVMVVGEWQRGSGLLPSMQ